MAFGIHERKQFVVACKRCRRDTPADVKYFPFQSIVVDCPSAVSSADIYPLKSFWGVHIIL
jgi:hypothetical protein